MVIRVAMQTDPFDPRQVTFCKALSECSELVELQALLPSLRGLEEARDGNGSSQPTWSGDFRQVQKRKLIWWRNSILAQLGRLPFGMMVQLIALRPDIIICEDFGTQTSHAALYRSIRRRSRLLVCATEPPRQNGLRERFIIRVADGVLADGEVVAQAIKRLSFPASRIFPIPTAYDLDAFSSCAATRSGPEAYRIIYSGDLSPQSGAADLLASLAAWAEQHPSQSYEVWWAGEGDLAGVLSAQPLPSNVSQSFLGSLDPPGMALVFGQSGLLVVPSFSDDMQVPVAQGLAAGLPVIGSKRNRLVRQLIQDDVNGWLFDPLTPGDLSKALSRALGSSVERLDGMRDRGQALVRPTTSLSVAQRIRRAIAAVIPEPVLEPVSS